MSSPTMVLRDIQDGEVGKFHQWWNSPNYPEDGSQKTTTRRVWGRMPFNLTHKRSSDGKYREGGNWLMEGSSRSSSCKPVTTHRYNNGPAYKGSYYVPVSTTLPYVLPYSSDEESMEETWEFGAEALSQLRPDTPDFTFFRETMELKDLPQSLKKRLRDYRWIRQKEMARLKRKYGRRFSKRVADDYIEFNFGWFPLYKTIKDFFEHLDTREKQVEQILRDANRPVRRYAMLHVDNDYTSFNDETSWSDSGKGHSSMRPIHVSQCYASGRGSHMKKTGSRRVWCKGRSRYVLPSLRNGKPNMKKIRRRLTGLRVTPDQLYNLIPWTWAIDWFTGLGHFMQAIAPGVGDRWIIEYAYIMDERQFTWYETVHQHTYGPDNVKQRIEVVYHRRNWRKARTAASLFGWGLSQEDLSPFQISIAGALGYSKVA